MTERSHKDYAIEFAEYMAKSAEQFLSILETEDTHPGDVADVRRGLRSSIYEFRKRAKRAKNEALEPQITEEQKTITQGESVDYVVNMGENAFEIILPATFVRWEVNDHGTLALVAPDGSGALYVPGFTIRKRKKP